MGILARYFSKEFLKLFLLLEFVFLSLYLLIQFILSFDDFVEASAPMSLMGAYLFYNTPFIMVQLVPVATLISVIVMFCLMEKNNEISAMKSCGLSILRLSRPTIIVSILVSIVVFLVSELIVPYSSARANEIWQVRLKKGDQRGFYGQDNIWYRGAGCIYWIRHFDSNKNAMEDLTFYFFDDSFRLTKRVDAKRAVWDGNKWEIQEGMVQEITNEGGYDLHKIDKMYLTLPERPGDFTRTPMKPEETSYWQLKRYVERIQEEGYDAAGYAVDMNIKLAYPLINVILVLIGIPIALGVKRGRTPLAVSLGIGVCFLYLISLGLSRSLGLSALLPPMLAAWLANLVFFLVGIYLMMRLET
ncbi:MAG: LPS export ABC transporter permease LptG [Pseudomonadota bacterium]